MSLKKRFKKLKLNKRILAGASAALVLLLYLFAQSGQEKTLDFGSRQLYIEEANSSHEKERGLSGRSEISDNYGMLFNYTEEGRHCMWMKEMKFPIDILWLDENKKVIQIAASVPPESFPSSFCPDEDAQYVLEVQSGLSHSSGVEVGSQL